MSTRANVKVIDKYGTELWFYRHSDGYPSGTLPTLKKFVRWVIEGKIRDNPSQSSGWLVLIGAKEYDASTSRYPEYYNTFGELPNDGPKVWKVGAYEPTQGEHGDTEYIYTVNLTERTIHVEGHGEDYTLTAEDIGGGDDEEDDLLEGAAGDVPMGDS